MGTAHEFTTRIRSFAECQRLNQVSKECGQVVVIDRNGNYEPGLFRIGSHCGLHSGRTLCLAYRPSRFEMICQEVSATFILPRSPPPPFFRQTTAIIFSLILTGVFLHVYL